MLKIACNIQKCWKLNLSVVGGDGGWELTLEF